MINVLAIIIGIIIIGVLFWLILSDCDKSKIMLMRRKFQLPTGEVIDDEETDKWMPLVIQGHNLDFTNKIKHGDFVLFDKQYDKLKKNNIVYIIRDYKKYGDSRFETWVVKTTHRDGTVTLYKENRNPITVERTQICGKLKYLLYNIYTD